ncbi:arabinogalactan endo-1,4-beta-galactosidase [Dichomitus squalens]|uniref:Arabinogalactan endo-beta-1,4-galactanase n=1 Tax=Dichomitus squalens TaxID=114155 RepID=A0A4Q9MZU8_9APHY|nr:arabinogalactan endo-1,4-beta-galactosidase [Dichomitus squalens]
MNLLLPLLLLSFSWLASSLNFHGADISSLTVVEEAGVHFKDNGKALPFETILKNHGMNAARVRIWTAGQYNLQYGLALGKRIKDAGMTLIVDLHFSDTWADPGHQSIPSSWPTDLDGLNTQIYSYTQNVTRSFANQGTPIDILQVGNEINNGLLWPVGEVSSAGYHPLSELLHSAINGAKSVASPKILIHLANGWDWSGLDSWFSNVYVPGALSADQVDIVGVSFYPFYDAGATLSALKSSLTNFTKNFGKPIVVAETDWPVSCSGVSLTEPSIPVSASGQQTWTNDIKNILAGLPNGRGQGIFYWEPGWVGSANLGSACADNLLVDSSGNTRTSINIFSQDM